MSLEIYIEGIECTDPEEDEEGYWRNFWAAYSEQNRLTNPPDPTLSESEEANQIQLLIQDRNRVHRQREKFDRLIPLHKERNARELRIAMNEIERKLKKILGNQVRYTPEPA